MSEIIIPVSYDKQEAIPKTDIQNDLTATTSGKVLDATQGKILNDNKLNKNFDFTAATLPYSNNEKIVLQGTDGNNYYTTIGELASQIGGGGGTSQTALVHYVKNCGTISSLNWTNSTIDNNITENMVVLKAELSNPAAQTSDWTCTTSNGYVTISGTISGSTNVLLYFGVSLSTAPSIIVNLASNNSDNVLKTNPTPGVMGVLGLSNGGTGVNATDAADLRSKMGITPMNIGAARKNEVNIPYNKSAKIIFSGQTSAIISISYVLGGAYETILYNGYGVDTARQNMTILSASDKYQESIGTDYQGVTITPTLSIITGTYKIGIVFIIGDNVTIQQI